MDDFVRGQGLPFLAHLMRRLSDDFVRGFSEWNREIGIKAPPRTHSTMQALAERGSLSVTELAALLHQSHPLVITWLRQLREQGLVASETDPLDGRRTILRLTKAGVRDVARQKESHLVITRAFRRLMKDAGGDIFETLWRIEGECRKVSFIERLRREGGPAQSPQKNFEPSHAIDKGTSPRSTRSTRTRRR